MEADEVKPLHEKDPKGKLRKFIFPIVGKMVEIDGIETEAERRLVLAEEIGLERMIDHVHRLT